MSLPRGPSTLLAAAALTAALIACAPEPAARKVLVVGIDGVRPDVLREVDTPHIDRLAATGTFNDDAQTTRPTVSGPGWSSMLTGVWPEKHGVVSNDFTPNRYDEYPDFLTRLERVDASFRTFAAVDWLPLGSGDAGGPLFGEAVDVKVVLDGYEVGWLEADHRSVEMAVEHLATADPDAMFVYLGNPDETSHRDGSIGHGYRAAIREADRHVGALVAAMEARATFAEEDWIVIVSTDHGRRADGGHGGDSVEESTIFYLVSGPSAEAGRSPYPPEIVDVAVTALAHLGVDVDPTWSLDGRPLGLKGASGAREGRGRSGATAATTLPDGARERSDGPRPAAVAPRRADGAPPRKRGP